MTKHSGHCHCGTVTFEIDAEIVELTTCDCSLCAMRNAVMTKVHETQLNVLSGEDELTLYQWNTGVAKHYFCKICGLYVFHRKRAAPDHFGVNVFCLDDFDRGLVPVRATEGLTMTVEATDPPDHWPGPRVAN
ncbi:MAG: type I-B CRISPR-associated protein Cas8b1/Cst1 [Pseudomonadota bacterium]